MGLTVFIYLFPNLSTVFIYFSALSTDLSYVFIYLFRINNIGFMLITTDNNLDLFPFIY